MSITVSDASASVSSYNKHHEEETSLCITPSTLQVDYDTDGVTELYKAITHQDWDAAIAVCEEDPSQAATWVVRHYDGDEDAILWRFLPLHSACARQPPKQLIAALLSAYSDAAACVDDQGMWALHYATGNRASASVIRLLLQHCRVAALQRDPRGMLPIHYLANWGPASMEVLELLLDAKTVQARDSEGNTPLDLALAAEYELRDDVVHRLQVANKTTTPLSSLASKASQRLSWRRAMFDDASVASTASGKPPRSTYSVGSSSTAAVSSVHKSDSRHEESESRSSAERHHHSSSRSSSSRDVDPPTLTHHTSGESISIASFAAPVDASLSTQEPGYTTEHEGDLREDIPLADDFAETIVVSKQSSNGSVTCQQLQEQIQELKDSLREKEQSLEEMQQLYSEAAELAGKHQDEADGLRTTLGNLMEQHELLQRKYSENKGRLESLTFSVESILEQQRVVKEEVDSILEREAARDELLERCAELKQPTDSKNYISACIEKQCREIDAVVAVINAAKE